MAEVTSAGAALSQRSSDEAAYETVLAPLIETFMGQVSTEARERPGGFTIALVLAFWGAAADLAEKQLGGVVGQFMRESQLPAAAFSAASATLAQSAELALSAAKTSAAIRAALGLSNASGSTFGRILNPDGSTLSWSGVGESLARTASTADLGADMLAQLRAEGYTHKRWITRYDSRVRETHANADRQTIPLEESFLVGGTSLRYPGDPMSADIGEVINCRCVLVGVIL